jgi:hypothetical protein
VFLHTTAQGWGGLSHLRSPMIATSTVCHEGNRPAAEPDFLEMLPSIRRVAGYAFRRLRRALREDLIAEVIANAFAAFRRLIARGRAALAYPTMLARYAIRQVREGRRVGSKCNVRDVLSPYAQRRKGFSVQPLPEAREASEWQELVVEDRHASPAEVAGLRIDFADWLKRLKRSKCKVALRLIAGDTTSEVAERFRLSPARVSQLRKELHRDWDEFQAVPAVA